MARSQYIMAKAVWITVKDGEGNDIKVSLDEVLGQVTAKDIINNFDPDDLLNEIGVSDAIRCFGEDSVFTYLDSFEVVPSHVSAIDIVSMYDKDSLLSNMKTETIVGYLGTECSKYELLKHLFKAIKQQEEEEREKKLKRSKDIL